MKSRRIVAALAGVAVLATGTACVQRNEDKKYLIETLEKSAHTSGVFRYTDDTPASPLIPDGATATVRGLIEDDFRFKARLTVNGKDAVDEIVADDALAVRFLDPAFIPLYAGSGGEPEIRSALARKFWVEDPGGAPPLGGAAVDDRVLGVDPIVDSLSVIAYAQDAVSQSAEVETFNEERIDYRPAEDPFPRPANGSGVTRWDVKPTPLPRADAADVGTGNASIAQPAVFRKMAIYIKDDRVVQIREQLAARFDLLDDLRNYIIRFVENADEKEADRVKADLARAGEDPVLLEAVLNLALNQIRVRAGEDPIRFRSMRYELSRQGDKLKAVLPAGSDVVKGSLDFFGVNAAIASAQADARSGSTTTTAPESATSTTAP